MVMLVYQRVVTSPTKEIEFARSELKMLVDKTGAMGTSGTKLICLRTV